MPALNIVETLTNYAANPPLYLDPELHLYYRTDGTLINLPSVTEEIAGIMGRVDYSAVEPDILSKAIRRGTCSHKRVEDYVKLRTDTGCSCSPCVKSHGTIWTFNKRLVDLYIANGWTLFSEIAFYDDMRVGCIDLIAVKWDKHLQTWLVRIIDLKTNREPHLEREYSQTNIYAELVRQYLVRNCMGQSYKISESEIWNGNIKSRYTFDETYGMDPAEKYGGWFLEKIDLSIDTIE